MTFLELKHRAPELYDQLLEACGGNLFAAAAAWKALYSEGKAEGAERERARCMAHLDIAERSGNTAIALAAITSGATVEQVARWYGAGAKAQIEGAG